jgi:hypothetical protein
VGLSPLQELDEFVSGELAVAEIGLPSKVAILMAQETRTAFYPQRVETALSAGGDGVRTGEAGSPAHGAMVTR